MLQIFLNNKEILFHKTSQYINIRSFKTKSFFKYLEISISKPHATSEVLTGVILCTSRVEREAQLSIMGAEWTTQISELSAWQEPGES